MDVLCDDFENTTYTYLSPVAHYGEAITESSGPYGVAKNSKGARGRSSPQGGGPLTEVFTEINKDEWKFVGMPCALGFKKGTVFTSLRLQEVGANKCKLTLHMQGETCAYPGVVFNPFTFGPVLQKTVEDAKYFLEHGNPSLPNHLKALT